MNNYQLPNLFYVDPQTRQVRIRGMEMGQQDYEQRRIGFLTTIGGTVHDGEKTLREIANGYEKDLKEIYGLIERRVEE